MYDNEFTARWSDVDLIRKREQTCVGLCTSRLGCLLVYTIKDTTPFTNEYLTRVSDYSWAVKRMTEITRERLPRVIDYSRALLSILLRAFWLVCSSSTRRQLVSFLRDLSRHREEHACDCKLSCGLYCNCSLWYVYGRRLPTSPTDLARKSIIVFQNVLF